MNAAQKDGRLSGLVSETVHSSKTLGCFLSVVFSRPAAELVDLGPVNGVNIAFLGERIGCKIYPENLYEDIDRHARQGELGRLPEFLRRRLALGNGSVDAVLGWDVFDYLAPAAASVLAGEVIRILRPGGVLLAFFSSRASDDPRYTKYFIVDETHLRQRLYSSACPRRWVLENRDIYNLFAGLELVDSLLLKSGVREILLQKPISPPPWRST